MKTRYKIELSSILQKATIKGQLGEQMEIKQRDIEAGFLISCLSAAIVNEKDLEKSLELINTKKTIENIPDAENIFLVDENDLSAIKTGYTLLAGKRPVSWDECADLMLSIIKPVSAEPNA